MRSIHALVLTLLVSSTAGAQQSFFFTPAPASESNLAFFPSPTRTLTARPVPDPVPAPVLPASRSAQPVDAADSLYRLGRSALTDGDFKRAAEVFSVVTDKYPDSEFAPDALYYRAYALYKSGTSRDLELAVTSLDRQATRYPKAGTLNDAKQLRASIRSEQARRGDGLAGQEIAMGAKTLRTESRCPTEDDDMRLTALNGIVQMDPDQVIPVLQKLLTRTDECSVRLRKRAVYMVAQTKEEERSDILLRVASTDPSTDVRRDAVQWLSEVNTERAAKALDSILFTARDAEIRDRALSALSRHRSPLARASVRRFAEQTNISTDLRARAISYIGSGRKAGDEAEFLQGLFAKTASPELKQAIIEAISNQLPMQIRMAEDSARGARSTSVGSTNAASNATEVSARASTVQWLLAVARDRKQEIEVRKRALHYAGQRGAVLKDLLAMYDEMSDQPAMQDQLLYVYNQRREPEAIDRLIQIAKSEKNPELRKKAIVWLGTKKDPRVKQFLLDLIGQ